MTPETQPAVAPATYAGTWTLERGESEEELPGILLVPEGGEEEPARVHAYVHDGDRVYSAELTPNGSGWRGEEARRTPHPFRLELEAFLTDGTLVVFGSLWDDPKETEEEGSYIGASFGLHHDDPEREGA